MSAMGDSGVGETAVEAGGNPSPPETRRPRRRVQSKLPFLLPRVEEEREGGGEPEESGSESDGKRKRKRKPRPRAPRKSPVTSKEAPGLNAGSKNSKEAQGLNAGSKNSLPSEGNGNCRQKNKQKGEVTPKKARKSRDPATSDSQQRQTDNTSDAAKNHDVPKLEIDQPVIDLRLEAKIAAQENVRLSAGKQPHPFFTSRKAAKKMPEAQDIMEMESRWSFPNGDYLVSCPLHVCDALEDGTTSLEWTNWLFAESSPFELNDSHTPEDTPSVFDASVKPLKLDIFSPKRIDLDQASNKVKESCSSSKPTSCILPNEQDRGLKLFSHLHGVHVSSDASILDNVENERQNKLMKERLTSYHGRSSYSPDCCLWTDKYQPGNALEVCGNRDSIMILSEWLKLWHERGLENSKTSKGSVHCVTEDDEESMYISGSDMDEIDDGSTLKNVLLITGPVGSGKSASIYACAKEQGFEVIEVNASDLRNGALVKLKYGEAMESHGFNRWSSEDTIAPRKKNLLELLSSPDKRESKLAENDSLEMMSGSCYQDTSRVGCSSTLLENITASHQVANKTLILFEDVDTVFDEDRGFISTILKLAETAKRPIILTSNNKNPVLPQVLYRLVLDFTLPSSAELLSHAYMICVSEKACVSPHLLELLIKSCLGDIRKTLMHLQFWCQGKQAEDRNMQFTYSPLPFDVDAAHLVMPRVLPWEFPCELSKKVVSEINQTISVLESLRLVEHMKQHEFISTETIGFSEVGNDVCTVKTRKNRRLKKKASFPDYTLESDHGNALEELTDALDFPVTCVRQTVRQRRNTILCSQSEDDDLPPTDTETSVAPILQIEESSNDMKILNNPVCQSTRADTSQNPVESSEMESASHICDTFLLQDVSCVPESSFVSIAETRDDGCLSTAAHSNFSISFAGCIESMIFPSGATVNGLDSLVVESSKYTSEDVVNACELDVESIHGTEEPGSLQNEEEGLHACVCNLMDECSRVDFSMPNILGRNSSHTLQVDSVQDAWRKFCSRHEELRSYLSTNHKDASLILELTSRLTDLISETDVMFDSCYPIVSDILEPAKTPSLEVDSFSWYEEQFEMGSTYAQHGLCLYTNKCALVGPNIGCGDTPNVAQEMLSSSNNAMALGKLLTWENSSYQNSHVEGNLHVKGHKCGFSIERGFKRELYNAVLPVVPARLSMALSGPAFHDYLSFMSQIAKLECSRLSENINNCRRRSRASRHYLSSGSLELSPEHVEILSRSNRFKDVVS